ncbi:MAG TPA: hypothetical protein VMX38_19110 [Verrucomicrobiae bacterium]|jgi:hypothetical protein|nr:hypothetical protein [Verrucomicrobiae bacterium]
MACMTIFAPAMTMATNEFTRVVRQEFVPTVHIESAVERLPLSMNWVVVTDGDGKAQLRMKWSRDS